MAELNAILDVMKFWPLQLGVRRPEPLSHKDCLFEIKYDGFRAIAQVEQVRCKLVSGNGNEFKSFLPLSESIGTERKRSVILDGEIVCLDADGKCLFYDLPFRKGQPRFVAFDLPHCDGQDLTYSPLVERKHRFRAILPKDSQSVLYCDHMEATGEELFALAVQGRSRSQSREAQVRTLSSRLGAVVQDPQPEVFAVGGLGEVLRTRARGRF